MIENQNISNLVFDFSALTFMILTTDDNVQKKIAMKIPVFSCRTIVWLPLRINFTDSGAEQNSFSSEKKNKRGKAGLFKPSQQLHMYIWAHTVFKHQFRMSRGTFLLADQATAFF